MDQYRHKWIIILNKCSMNLMLLIVETSKQEADKVAATIGETEGVIASESTGESDSRLFAIEQNTKNKQT